MGRYSIGQTAASEDGRTWCGAPGHVNVLRLFLEVVADPIWSYYDDLPPLHMTASYENETVIALLHRYGLDPE